MLEDFIVIRGQKIEIDQLRMDVSKLKFFAENPRIFSAIGADVSEPSQDEIQSKLAKMDHVKELIQDIKLNGDLIDPIFVRDGSYDVLEGNSRLAAYRELIKQDPLKWGQIRCTLLPSDIDEGLIFALLGQYHIKGKKDWQPFEQAGFLHRRHTKQGVPVDTLSKELGLKLAEARNLVATYAFMIDSGVKDPNKWSYFYEYIKSRKIKKHRNENKELDKVVVSQIRSGAVGKALDFREGIKILGEATSKIVSKYADGIYTFDEAIGAVEHSGSANEIYKRLNRFRNWINKEETREGIAMASQEEKRKIIFEQGKIYAVVKRWKNQ